MQAEPHSGPEGASALARIEVRKLAVARFDAVVIGAGVGGLCAAAGLARLTNAKVLVLEQHQVSGGMLQHFRKPGGFVWGVGVHAIGEVGEGQRLRQVFDLLGEDRIKWRALPEPLYRIRFPGLAIEQASDPQQFAEALTRRYPGASRALARYPRDVAAAAKFLRRQALCGALSAPVAGLLRAWQRFAGPWARLTLADYLADRFGDPELRSILGASWGLNGLAPGQVNFAAHALWQQHYAQGAHAAVGGSRAIAVGLEATIRSRGGQIMTGRRAQSIEVEGGRVLGVKAVDHRGQALSVEAPVVIAAAGAVHGRGSLLPAAYREQGEALQALDRQSPCCVVIYFGLASEAADFGAGTEQMWLAESSDGGELAGGDGLFEDDQPIACQLKLPRPAPEDRHYPTAQAIIYVQPEHFAPWADTTVHQRGQAYETLKRRLSERVLRLIEAELPGFTAAVRQTEVATPLSFAHFAGSSRGAALGLPHTNERYVARGASLRTSIAGLYLAGSDVFHGGVGGAAVSGLLAAGASMGGWLQLKLARPWLS